MLYEYFPSFICKNFFHNFVLVARFPTGTFWWLASSLIAYNDEKI